MFQVWSKTNQSPKKICFHRKVAQCHGFQKFGNIVAVSEEACTEIQGKRKKEKKEEEEKETRCNL